MTQTMYLTRLAYPPISGEEGEKTYPIYSVETNEQVGMIITHPSKNSAVYISWYIDKEHEGKGYMFDAVVQLLPKLFELGYHRIVAMIWTTNERSKQLARRLGFHYEGTAQHLHKRSDGEWQDVEFWALVEGVHVHG